MEVPGNGREVVGHELIENALPRRVVAELCLQPGGGHSGHGVPADSPRPFATRVDGLLQPPYFTAEVLRYIDLDRVCVPVPFYHCFGMVLGNLATMTHGACVVVPGESLEARAVLEAVDPARCTSLYGVPSPSLRTPSSTRSTSRLCGQGSWPARRVPLR